MCGSTNHDIGFASVGNNFLRVTISSVTLLCSQYSFNDSVHPQDLSMISESMIRIIL